MNLTQKERLLLEDQKSHEELCVKKYNNFSQQAKDPQLKQLLQTLAQQEQQHLDTINQILNGHVPNTNQQNSQQQNNQQPNMENLQNQSPLQGIQSGMKNEADADLCTDLLATEKYVSATYNTAIFEFRDPNIRKVLNHIQKEEQKHGEAIFNYMQSKGMYNPKP